MKVLLISANRLKAPYPVYPLGVDHVAGAISLRHEVKVLDLCVQGTDREIRETIDDFAPQVVGLSMRNVDNTDLTNTLSFADDFIKIVQQIRSATEAPVVLGGCAFSLFPEELMHLLNADYGLVGEGERLLDLLDALQGHETPAGIPGLYTRGAHALPPEPWAGPIARCLDGLSQSIEFYTGCGGMLNLQTKRGCPFHCVYCTYNKIEGHKLRRFPPAEIAHVARRLQDAGARFLFFTDSIFNCDFDHNLEVASSLIAAGVSIPWGAFFSPLPMPDGYFPRLKESGLTHVEFGTEALCDRTLKAYRKPFAVSDVLRAHEAAIDADLKVAHYFLLGGPGEDLNTLDETLTNADSIPRTALFFFNGMRIYPGTELYDIAAEEGQIKRGESLLEPVFYRSGALAEVDVTEHVKRYARGRVNWIIGSGGPTLERLLARLYAKGFVGPLWDRCIL